MKNKIGWCNATWNPVWGCHNRGECKKYCYARVFAKRFYRQTAKLEYKNYICSPSGEDGDPYDVMRWIDDLGEKLRCFIPTFLEAKFRRKFPKKSQRIFVGSMSEIYYWEQEWIERVIEKIKEYPQHIFQFLTKYPGIYSPWVWPENCWLGITITKNPKDGESDRWDYYEYKQHNKGNLKFVCFEPLLMQMQLIYYLNLEDIDWVIVGSETGNRKDKVIPKKAWIEDIRYYCKINNIPIYLKDNLKEIYPEEIKMFPEVK